VPALDGLRAFAILAVFGHDYNLFEDADSALGRLIGLVVNAGWLGVQLFFVLSGYLITGILIDTRRAENYWGAFLGRRALRIFPLYYAVLFAAFVVAPLVGHRVGGAEHQIWFWCYLANWAEPFGRSVSIFPHFWSLSIEEQFYFFWPLVVRYSKPKQLVAICAALVALAVASRLLVRPMSVGPTAAYMFTVCRVDALALGALGAVIVRDDKWLKLVTERRTAFRVGTLALLASTIVLTRGAPRTGLLTESFGYTVFAVVFAYVVLDVVLGPADDRVVRFLSIAPLRAIGRYSYAMYVFHMPIQLLVGQRVIAAVMRGHGEAYPGVAFSIAYLCGATALTFALAVASFHLLEKHFLALKRRVEPRLA
jgi:peptidoglycan/LPS O-acetylase OafA/YrhL